MIEKEEYIHAATVLEKTKEALLEKNPLKLKALSNNTIHSAASYQDPGSITTAVIIYTISKLIERGDYEKIRNWDNFVKKLNSILDLAILALKKENHVAYAKHMLYARKTLESISNLKPYIEEVIRKASINKGGKLYEHGISLEQTAHLLGVTQWELSEYAAQRTHSDFNLNKTIDIKSRIKMAMEFFS